MKKGVICLTVILLFANSGKAEKPAPKPENPEVELAQNGQALLPIVISPNASPEVEELAKTLADGLKRITGATFEIRREDFHEGIQFGTAADWPGLLPDKPADRSEVLCRETYLLQTAAQKLRIVGRTPLALQDATWDFFYRLGFRQFFPGSDWEIWPELPNARISLNTVQSPDYYTRKIFLAGGIWPENQKDDENWQIRNRMVSGFVLSTAHSYNQIIGRNSAVFSAHPEYIADPGAAQQKFDPSHPEVLQIVAQDALNQLKTNSALDSVSIEPSDGGGWRQDSPLGSPSDQAVTLANYVAEQIQKDYPGRKVGMYAYNQHSPPPDIPVNPNVIVSVATSFLRGGYTVDQLLSEWHQKGAEVGLREYLSVYGWSRDMPGQARAANLDYVVQTIPYYYSLGVRYWISEASNGWGAQGLGYYLSSRLLWDVNEAKQKNALVEDFLQRSFQEAAPEMREFFKLIAGENRPLISEDLLGRMYRLLDAAEKKTNSLAVLQRLQDLVAFTHYIDLDLAYRHSDSEDRQAAYDRLAAFSYQIRSTGMCNSHDVIRYNPKTDKQIKPVMAEGQTSIPRYAALPPPNFAAILQDGVANKKLNDFVSVAFSKDLVPFEKSATSSATSPTDLSPVRLRGTNKIYLFSDSPQTEFVFEAKGGMVRENSPAVSFKLYSPAHAIVDEAVASAEIPADKQSHTVKLKSPYGGLHILEISDGHGGTDLTWPVGQRAALPVSPDESDSLASPGNWVFYVPKSSKVLGFYAGSLKGKLLTPEGKEALALSSLKMPGTFSVPVPTGAGGQCWFLNQVRDQLLLLTVPPYLARSAAELLVPKEALSNKADE